MRVVDIVFFMTLILIRMTFITLANDNDGAVAVDNFDQLVIRFLFRNLFIIIIL